MLQVMQVLSDAYVF